jgi:hypothetical protein
MFIGDASVTQLQEYGDEVECCIHIALNLLNLFLLPSFRSFSRPRGIITVQTQGSESGMGKSDRRKYSCLQGRFSTVTVGPDFPEPNEALPSQRNNPQEGRQIDRYNHYNRNKKTLSKRTNY